MALNFSELVNILNLSPLRVWFQESPLSSKVFWGWHDDDNLLKPNICYQTRSCSNTETMFRSVGVLVCTPTITFSRIVTQFHSTQTLEINFSIRAYAVFLRVAEYLTASYSFIRFEDWNWTWLCSSTSKCWDDVRLYLNGYANTISGFRQLLFSA